ncbi:MAG TPA: 3-hydroxyacyl-CoA dehydrogenase NAD-binding domain-containing protein [Afifellaceae bacterium]|nr:3-hydroxyacyl-CoA dehydrogenase NAD-binding domain-containing protein [Afifellaceae bacterium]
MAPPHERAGKAAVIGCGVIGAGWAARLALNGIDVAVFDADPDVGDRLDAVIANARRAWESAGWPIARQGAVSVTDCLQGALVDADVIQESLPERLDLKQRVLGEISASARPDALIASSTSGLLPSDMATTMVGPERFLVAHPFNPVYLMPLVEIVGGEKTVAGTLEKAQAFYAGLGMAPLRVRHEVPGFIADRLMEALWREALHLVNDGHATAAEIDTAITEGPGLRWAFIGPFMTYRLGGGKAGMRQFMQQFGPALNWPWTKLEAPELTDALLERIVAQSDEQARTYPEGGDPDALERWRDENIIAILKARADPARQ